MMDYPFLRPEFLAVLEASGCVGEDTGWEPNHLSVGDGASDAFMPLYVKTHSYGEYVFDWAWANAYHQHGLNYYPKLLTAIPFTPATGPRIRFNGELDPDQTARQLIEKGINSARELDASSWHILFPDEEHLALLKDERLIHRQGVQYHWFNRDYGTFDDFLAALSSRKRKMIRRERRQVAEQGLTTCIVPGDQISEELWHFFYQVYHQTYLKRSGGAGYLNPVFFQRLGQIMPEQLTMAVAYNGKQPAAAALFFFDNQHLYGRYWGCKQEFDFLHFELCYYQGIDFAIQKQLKKFDAGAQGEHKILRGFEPVTTHSLHWIAEPAFARAIKNFTEQEARQLAHHRQEAESLLPFKHEG